MLLLTYCSVLSSITLQPKPSNLTSIPERWFPQLPFFVQRTWCKGYLIKHREKHGNPMGTVVKVW